MAGRRIHRGKGKGKDWAEKALSLTAEVVRRPRRPRYVWVKEGEEIDWERIRKLLPEPGFTACCRGGGWWSGRSRGESRTGG